MQSITVLGATGSIGASTLDVVARHPDRYRVFALSGHTRVEALEQLCRRFEPAYAAMVDRAAAAALQQALRAHGCRTEVLAGPEGLRAIAADARVHTVMAAIVGAAGLEPTLAAAAAGKRVLLANKEALVMAGQVFVAAARRAGAVVLPIDSEHNAVFQCLPPDAQALGSAPPAAGVRRILLTASGGPFRRRSLDEMRGVTAEEACAHPNWRMGRKISVDSATMMNKGLELIEAHFLFGLSEERIDVVVHPQSVIHSMVEYVDGSVLAQLGNPDMRTPIAHALAYPERIASGVGVLDLPSLGRLEFEPPDPARFPCLRLAREALRAGGGAPCVLNAANEVAVDAFLAGEIAFTDIAEVNEDTLQALGHAAAPADVGGVLALDAQARQRAAVRLARCAA